MGSANVDAIERFASQGVSSSTDRQYHLRMSTSLTSGLATVDLELVRYFWPSRLSELTLPYVEPENFRVIEAKQVLQTHLL